MTLKLRFLATALVAFSVYITACKKEAAAPVPAAKTTPVSVNKVAQSDQQGSAEADAAVDNVNDFINNKVGGGSSYKTAAYNLPCGVVSVDSTVTNGKKVYWMNYGKRTPCGYKKKSGKVSFELVNGTAFNQMSAKYKITFLDYVVESYATGDTVKINGYLTVQNVKGGYIWQAVTKGDTITYRVRGTFAVTYANGNVRNKSYFQLRTYNSPSKNWAGLTHVIAGDTLTNLYEIGKTLEGNYDYQLEAIKSFTWSNCGTTYAGPYLLKTAHARMNVAVPNVSPAYIDIEGGYYWNYAAAGSTPTLVNDCNTNAYKITTVIGALSSTKYQLY